MKAVREDGGSLRDRARRAGRSMKNSSLAASAFASHDAKERSYRNLHVDLLLQNGSCRVVCLGLILRKVTTTVTMQQGAGGAALQDSNFRCVNMHTHAN